MTIESDYQAAFDEKFRDPRGSRGGYGMTPAERRFGPGDAYAKWRPTITVGRATEAALVAACEAALPLLVRLGDFIANAESRCDVILQVRDALALAKGGAP